jgi:hypothetical protein
MGNRVRLVFSKRFLLALTYLLVFDVLLGVASRYLLSGVEYFRGKSAARTVSDFAFVEGAILFFVGAFSAFYFYGFSLRELRFFAFAALLFFVSVVAGMAG